MNNDVKAAWLKMEEAKVLFLSMLSNWPTDRLMATPGEGWSALQIVEHLIMSENGTLEYLRRKSQAPATELEPAGEQEAEVSRKLNLALKSDHRWEAPPVLAPPRGDQSLEHLVEQWSVLRSQWKRFLDELAPDYYDKKMFRHPLAGRLNLEQTLSFVEHHIRHHVHQLRRLQG